MRNQHFTDRLVKAIQSKGTSLIVGLDPRLQRLPASLRDSIHEHDWRKIADSFKRFCTEVINVVAPLVPAVKPQSAFFEQLGPLGMVALAEVIDHAKDAGLMVILDGKRNDIGSTAVAYAQAYLGQRPSCAWSCDALTVNPYLGDDSLLPMLEHAVAAGSGLFALVKTSNPGSRTFQELPLDDGRRLYQAIAQWIESQAAKTTGQFGYGILGAVIGATHPEHLAELRQSMPHTFFLLPGFGAQGGQAADVKAAFDETGLGAVVNSSRKIIFAYEDRQYANSADWQSAVESATCDAISQLAAV